MTDLLPWQRRACAWAITCVALAVIGSSFFGLFALLTRFVNHFAGVIGPLVIAAVLSLLLDPVCDAVQRHLRLSRVASIIVLYLLVVLTAAGIGLVLMPALWEQLQGITRTMPAKWDRLVAEIGTQLPAAAKWLNEGGLLQWVKTHAEQIFRIAGTGAPALAEAGSRIGGIFAKVAGMAIIPVYLFYLLDMRRDFVGDLERETKFLPEKLRADLVFLARQFVDIIVAFFRGQILIGLILGTLLSIGFSAVGVSYGLLLGLLMGLGNIIPYLGTMLGLAIVLPIAYLQDGGGTGTVGAALAVIVVVQLLDGYFVTPRIMGKTTGLHPMAIILSVFFWGSALDGILGLLLAVPLTAFLTVFWRLLKARLHREQEPGK